VLGLRGEEKMYLIIKLQAVARGIAARRRVKKVYGFKCSNQNRQDYLNSAASNYDNPLVQGIKQKLGQFNYSPGPSTDGIKR
jgi:hypothetical protein